MSSTGKQIRILAISGSLRANSSNNAVIALAATMAPANVQFTIYDGIGRLPHFDDGKEPGLEVAAWRNALRTADGVLICSPEYAFGVPGTLKNALDWTVSSGELVYKPLALITAATGGDKAHAALLNTFTALSSNIPEGGAVLISYIRSKMDKDGNIVDAATIAQIQGAVDALIQCIVNRED